MEQINTIELNDESMFPNNEILEKVLGDSFQAYKKLLEMFDNNNFQYEWRYYKDGKSWLCKVQKKAKTIIWMSAWKGFIKATIYFPEKYLNNILDLSISQELKDSILITKNVGKSKPCMFEIRDESILKDLETVMNYKAIVKYY